MTGANVAGFILVTALFAMFLMLTLYMQQVLGYSAMKTGVGYLAVAGTAIFWSALAAQLTTNMAANVVSPSNDFSNLDPKRISYVTGGLITAVNCSIPNIPRLLMVKVPPLNSSTINETSAQASSLSGGLSDPGTGSSSPCSHCLAFNQAAATSTAVTNLTAAEALRRSFFTPPAYVEG